MNNIILSIGEKKFEISYFKINKRAETLEIEFKNFSKLNEEEVSLIHESREHYIYVENNSKIVFSELLIVDNIIEYGYIIDNGKIFCKIKWVCY